MTVAPQDRTRKTIVPIEDRVLIDAPTAAAMCSVSRPTWDSWVAAGLIQPVALPFDIRRRLFRREAVEKFANGLGASA